MRSSSLILVHPPQQGLLEGFSAGLIALANYVSDRAPDVEVRLIDLGLVDDDSLHSECAAALSQNDRTLVAISTTTASYQAALRVARTMKSIDPDCVVILGGHHASPESEIVLRYRNEVDAVVEGEGERALLALAEGTPMAQVPNLSYRDEEGAVRKNAVGPLLSQPELDSIGPLFPGMISTTAPGKFEHVTYVSARGCPLACAFCAVANQSIRHKSTAAIQRDLRILVNDLGARSVAMEDNFFAHSPRRTIELCSAIEDVRRDLPFDWDCQTRVESMQHEETITTLARAGCSAVYLGVESLVPRQLEFLQKTRATSRYLDLLRDRVIPALLRSPIDSYINLQVGIPHDTLEEQKATLRELRHLGALAASWGRTLTIFPQLFVVYPGTQHGRFLQSSLPRTDAELLFERFTEWESSQQPVLNWLGENFAHGTGGIPLSILSPSFRDDAFAIDELAVRRIASYLDELRSIRGVEVFRYQPFIAKAHHAKRVEGA